MKLNKPLTITQKLQLFLHFPGVKIGLGIFLFTSILLIAIYLQDNTQSNMTTWWGLLAMLVFPALGIYLMHRGYSTLPRTINALENGVCVEGQLIREGDTNETIMDKKVKQVTLKYELYNKPYQLTELSLKSVKKLKEHLIMVDANDPEFAVYLESLPEDLKQDLKRRNGFS
jgi:hypothetical protein